MCFISHNSVVPLPTNCRLADSSERPLRLCGPVTGADIAAVPEPLRAHHQRVEGACGRPLPACSGMRRAGYQFWDLERGIVDVAPQPILTRLEALDDGMSRCVEVGGGVSVGRVVAASDVPACHASPQVHPLATDSKTVLASIRRWRDIGNDGVDVRTNFVRHLPHRTE